MAAAIARAMADKIVSYRDLVAWQKAIDLADLVYEITARFPSAERLGLTFQMRKAAVSVPSNLAEGTRHRRPGYLQRVVVALGEHAELETQAIIAFRRRHLSADEMTAFTALSTKVGELAHGLRRSLEAHGD